MYAVRVKDDDDLFDVEEACRLEGERRAGLLGDLLDKEYLYTALKERSRLVHVPIQELIAWWKAYQHDGMKGLQPRDWKPLDEKSQQIVRERRAQLGELADQVEVTPEQLRSFINQGSLSKRTKMRLFRRYRIGGIWGLAPHYNPEKPLRGLKKRTPKRALATLDEAAFAEIDRRYLILGEKLIQQVVSQGSASRKAVCARAQEVGVSEKTIWNYLAAYREYGMLGLAPQERSDKGMSHTISDRMRNVIRGLRLSKRKRLSVRTILTEACKRARALGEPEPTEGQVRRICASISKSDRLLAEGREKEFKNAFGITYPMTHEEEQNPRVIYEIDHTQVDILVKDIREKYRTKSAEIRPWLTLCIERRSRLIMAAILGYDRPDQYTVAAAIREAILVSEEKPYGGVPDIILVDNGKELLSHHIQHLTQELHIILRPCIRHQPQQKGKVERFFGTLNTRLWSTLPGYVDSNTEKRNPHAKAELTMAQLEAKLRTFLEQYHHEVHSQLRHQRTPLQYWMENCYAEEVDTRKLDVLLMKATRRRVIKTGIKYEHRLYWHTALADLVGKDVLIRRAPTYTPPDDIEVFYRDMWICTAFATDSATGKAITSREVRFAQQEQRKQARHRIHAAQTAVTDADTEIAASEQQWSKKDAPSVTEAPVEAKQAVVEASSPVPTPQKEGKRPGQRAPDLLDLLGTHYTTQQ